MSNADKTTIRTRAYPAKRNADVPQSNLTEEQNYALELVKKTAQLEEEKKKSLEYLKSIEQLREILKQEQAKTAEMAKKMAGLEAKEKEFAELEAKVRELNASARQDFRHRRCGEIGLVHVGQSGPCLLFARFLDVQFAEVICLQPHDVDDAECNGQTHAQYPGEVPHVRSFQ